MSWYEKHSKQCEIREKLWGIDWPGHPGNDGVVPVKIGNTRDSLVAEPERWTLVRVTHDPEADYSYDDLAFMVRNDNLYILVNTSGCSCPSPTDTWGIVAEGTIEDMLACCSKEAKSWGGEGTFRGPWREMYNFLLKFSDKLDDEDFENYRKEA